MKAECNSRVRAATAFGVVLLVVSSTVRAGFQFGVPRNLGPVVNSAAFQGSPEISADGLTLYFDSNRAGGQGDVDIWMTTRTPGGDWGIPVPLPAPINTPYSDSAASLSADGLSLYFGSNRPGGYGSYDLYVTTRKSQDAPWGPPLNLGLTVNGSSYDNHPSIAADGLSLYFDSDRAGSLWYDIWVTKRATLDSPWETPVHLGPAINDLSIKLCPFICGDNLTLFFDRRVENREIWMARRRTPDAPWEPAVGLDWPVNSSYWDTDPSVAADGSMLYFGSYRPGGFGDGDLWQVPILPAVDFNGDGKVDAADRAILLANWGKSDSVCDIGPYPWGDDVVDEKDLSVLLKETTGTGYVRSPLAHASRVPCNAGLTWTAVPFAAGYDVYLGTSWADVDSADRTHPQGVLVSQGQTATAHKPQAPLSYGRTYYWRVDFVGTGPAPIIYRGGVLDFTTEAFAYPIKNVTATASSAQRGSDPVRTVDGSGLDPNDGHSTRLDDMWWSKAAPPQWIQYQFDQVYKLHELWVWNFNSALGLHDGVRAKTVKIEYSTDGTTWTALANVPEFAQAPGVSGYVHNTTVSFGGVSAQCVRLTIEKNWGNAANTGLSEVRFFYIPDRATAKP